MLSTKQGDYDELKQALDDLLEERLQPKTDDMGNVVIKETRFNNLSATILDDYEMESRDE